jgi:hypothetical protein
MREQQYTYIIRVAADNESNNSGKRMMMMMTRDAMIVSLKSVFLCVSCSSVPRSVRINHGRLRMFSITGQKSKSNGSEKRDHAGIGFLTVSLGQNLTSRESNPTLSVDEPSPNHLI